MGGQRAYSHQVGKGAWREWQLYYWIAKFKEEDAVSAAQTRWLQLEAGESPALAGAFEVRVGDATIVVKPGFDPEALASIVRTFRLC